MQKAYTCFANAPFSFAPLYSTIMKKIFVIGLIILSGVSCKEKMSEQEIATIGRKPCRKPAAFIQQVGMNPLTAAFTTTDKKLKGVVLVQPSQNPSDSVKFKIYQDSSWKQFGFMGSLTTDENGNVYTANIPMVNNLDMPIMEMNKIYRIDAQTGKMNLFYTLPKADSVEGVVPFGIMGVYYDCHGQKLYASSVSGSTRDAEKGVVYVIDLSTQKVVDELKGYDAIGLFVGGTTGDKRLYFGSARTSNLLSVELNKDGTIANKTKVNTELSLDNLGPRGNDKARRIRYDKNGNLFIYGLDFNYNLAAQTEKPETEYQFNFDDDEKKWVFSKIIR